jgi:hypothetical protein
MNYSRRQLYALGEPLGESATRLKVGGRIYGGGGGNPVGDIFDDAGEALGDVVGGAGDILGDVVGGVGDAIGGIGDAVGDIGSSIDDFVADTIPGGWTTLAEIGVSFTPLGAMGSAGVGALSGGTRKGKGGFDLSGAIMGGLQGYGVGSMTQSLANAGAPGPEMPETGGGYSDAPIDISSEIPTDLPPAPEPQVFEPSSLEGAVPPAETNFPSGNEIPPYQASNDFTNPNSVLNRSIEAPSGLDKFIDKASQTGQGIKNITGFGPEGFSGIMPAAEAVNAGMSMTAYSGLGSLALQEMAKKNQEDYDRGQIPDAEYLKNQQRINEAIAQAEENVRMNPYEKDPSMTAEQASLYARPRKTLYDEYAEDSTQPQSSVDSYGLGSQYGLDNPQRTLYASGGTVANYEAPDDMMGGGLASGFNFAEGGDVPAYGIGGYARGGEPRFLSGGGDGMSDSIRATIDGRQEARLADGEFVIPADVVSHLGNGSSKAGAKQLHAMMNRIRKARTGNPKQGKQINPNKLMPA